jgi:hypothetical protein
MTRHTVSNAVQSWYRGRLVQTLRYGLANPVLCVLLPVAFLAMRDAARRVLVTMAVLFSIGYAIYLFFLPHYVVSIMPSLIGMILMSWEFFAGRGFERKWVNAFFLVSLGAIGLSALWPVEPMPAITAAFVQDQRPANAYLSRLPKTPAVVLFRFDPMVGDYDDDPVYNDGVVWPDDAEVIRARDLGAEKNREIVRYYANRQPGRVFYVYDPDERAVGRDPILGPFGAAGELAAGGGTVP